MLWNIVGGDGGCEEAAEAAAATNQMEINTYMKLNASLGPALPPIFK